MKEREMLEDKTWEEFRDTGLMMFVNVVLQIFGWSLVYNPKDKTMIPCKSKYRGFNEKTLAKNFIKLSKYMQDNADELLEDAKIKELIMKYILIDQNTAKEEIDKFLEGTEKEILRVICEEVIKPTYLCINYSGKPFVITAEYFADVMQLALAVQIEEGPAKTYPHVKDNYYEGIRGVNYHCRQPRNPHSMECQECQMAVHNLRSKHGNSYTESRPKYIHHVASE